MPRREAKSPNVRRVWDFAVAMASNFLVVKNLPKSLETVLKEDLFFFFAFEIRSHGRLKLFLEVRKFLLLDLLIALVSSLSDHIQLTALKKN